MIMYNPDDAYVDFVHKMAMETLNVPTVSEEIRETIVDRWAREARKIQDENIKRT